MIPKDELYLCYCPGTAVTVGQVRILPGLRQLAGNDYEARAMLAQAEVAPAPAPEEDSPVRAARPPTNLVRILTFQGHDLRLFQVRGHDGVQVWFAGVPTSEAPTVTDVTGPWVRGATRYIVLQQAHARVVWKARAVEDGVVSVVPACVSRHDVLQLARAKLPGAPVLDYLRCVHCGDENFDEYMVRADVWQAAGLRTSAGRVHFACLEERLGRALAVGDFTDARLNDPILFGYRMGLSVQRAGAAS